MAGDWEDAVKPGSDAAFLLQVLSDGQPHSQAEILRRSFDERGVGLTVHSRKSDLVNKHGYEISCWRDPRGGSRGGSWFYQLAGGLPAEPGGAERTTAGSAGSSSPQTVSTREPSKALPSLSDADAVTFDRGPRQLSDLDRAAADSYIEALLGDGGFELYRGEWDHVPVELTDDDLAEELAEQQRALFLEAA